MALALALAALVSPQDNFPEIQRNDPVTKADIPEALRIWKEFGLPVPSASARPYKFKSGSDSEGTQYVEIVLVDRAADGSTVIYHGNRVEKGSTLDQSSQQIDWTSDFDTKTLSEKWWSSDHFKEDQGLATAVQGAALGKTDFALKLLANLPTWPRDTDAWIGRAKFKSLKCRVGMVAATFLVNRFLDEPANRPAIVASLRRLDSLGLFVHSRPGEFHYGDIQETIDGLAASIEPVTAASGTPEYAVAMLSKGGKASVVGDFGMRAVPALIEAMDSKAFTLEFCQAFMNGVDRLRPVSELAASFISSASKQELSPKETFTSADALSWYRAKQSGRIADFCLNDLVETHGEYRKERTYRVVSGVRMAAMVKFYPQFLPEAFDRLTSVDPPLELFTALRTLMESSVASKVKLPILLRVANSASPEHRVAAFRYLPANDMATFNGLMVSSLKSVGPQPSEPYADCVERELAQNVTASNDTSVWREYERAVSRASTAFRIVLLAPGVWSRGAPEVPEAVRFRIKLLQKYFDDTSTPSYKADDPMFEGFGYWTSYEDIRVSVGRVALCAAAEALKLPGLMKTELESSKWDALRKAVDKEIADRYGQ